MKCQKQKTKNVCLHLAQRVHNLFAYTLQRHGNCLLLTNNYGLGDVNISQSDKGGVAISQLVDHIQGPNNLTTVPALHYFIWVTDAVEPHWSLLSYTPLPHIL